MKAQAFDGISRDLGQVSRRRSITRLLGGVAALGAAAMVGRGDVEAKKHKKRKAKSGAPGPAGPAGPAGSAGVPGAPGAPGAPSAPLTLSSFNAPPSAVLGTAAGTFVESIAKFDVGWYPVNCGWTYFGDASDFEHTTTEVVSGFIDNVGFCRARLRRTAAVGSAGGQIKVVATGLRLEPISNS